MLELLFWSVHFPIQNITAVSVQLTNWFWGKNNSNGLVINATKISLLFPRKTQCKIAKNTIFQDFWNIQCHSFILFPSNEHCTGPSLTQNVYYWYSFGPASYLFSFLDFYSSSSQGKTVTNKQVTHSFLNPHGCFFWSLTKDLCTSYYSALNFSGM